MREGGGEGTDVSTQLALRGAEPFADAGATARFRRYAQCIFDALIHARTPEAST
jgi:hypothetical protein